MLLFLLTTVACDLAPKSCNLMYAPDMVSITLESGVFFTDGETVYTFDGDGEVITCTLAAAGDYAVCDDDNGSSLEVSGDSLSGSLWEFSPGTLSLSVTVDGEEQGSWSADPAYTEDEPNGEGCGFRSYGEVSFDLAE